MIFEPFGFWEIPFGLTISVTNGFADYRSAVQDQYRINLDNPYSLQNVQEALDIVVGAEAPHLTATHHYVRFLPQDSMDMYILVDSLDLDIFPYPLDRDLTWEEMEEYENTMINGFTWQYCLLEPDFPMPTEMVNELLDYAYLQEEPEGEGTRAVYDQLDFDIYDMAIDKAMELAGCAPAPTRANDAWYPSARITYATDVGGEIIPLQGVLVRANTTFNTCSKYTDGKGEVSNMKGKGGRFKNRVQYKIIWKTDKWKIRDRASGKAKYEAKQMLREKWIFEISGDNETAMHATIHRALYEYYYGKHLLTTGLVKNSGLNVRAYWNQHDPDGQDSGYFYWIILGLNVNDIYIYSDSPFVPHDRFPKFDILSTTFHELGHASHYRAVINTSGMNRVTHYKNAAKIVKESWAMGVEYAYIRSLYSTKNIGYPSDVNYTAIVESLMNQGLTLQQLQSTVVGKTTWEQWRTAVKALGIVPGVIVDMLFSNPCDVVRTNISNNVISGPADPGLNTTATYTVPTGNVLPSGMSFDGFAVSGKGYTIASNAGGQLKIQFATSFSFTINATYTLPDGSKYTCSKIVERTAKTPILLEKRTYYNMGGGNQMMIIGFSVTNPQAGATYEWMVGGRTFSGTSTSIDAPPNLVLEGQDYITTVKCRATLNGTISPWSMEHRVVYPFGTF